MLSIPYWDFLVLNLFSASTFEEIVEYTFNSLLGFSSFESEPSGPASSSTLDPFNSLLGFSSFESGSYTIALPKWWLDFQFPIGIF